MNAIEWMLIGAAIVGVTLIGRTALRRWRAQQREEATETARRRFHERREWFEARFLTLAGQSGKPRGLTWGECDFQKDVAFARQRETGQLQAFVGVLVRFKAIEGGGMEDNPNVGAIREATAVFSYVGDNWQTDGRTVFNLNPAQTIQRFQHELDLVE